MRFLHPEMASWLLMLPLAASFWHLHRRAKQRFRRDAPISPRIQALSRLTTRRGDAMTLVTGLSAMTAIVVAMMRPQVFVETATPDYERQDLVLMLDRSVSMQAQDIRPSRFSRAIQEIKAFLLRKPEGIDRVALVGFAGSSVVLSHLTRDVDSLIFYLDWIEEDRELHFGTDIGAALASARDLVRKDDRPTRKIFLVLSDGDDQGTELARALVSLREEGTRVYTIGIGSGEHVPIPASLASNASGFLEDDQGRLLTTRFEERTLRNIATLTGARYFRSVTGNELAEAMREVVGHERKLVGWKTSAEYRDVYPLALGSAAVATFLFLLTV